MSAYNPGTGWRAADQQDDVRDCIAYWDAETRTWNHWVREAPVPPLPTAPYTVIRVTPPAAYAAGIPMLYVHDGTRYAMVSLNSWLTLENAEDAADFGVKVLSEPRGVTAKAVIDRMHEESGYSVTLGITLAKLAREFGVES